MNQKGFVNLIVLVLLVLALIGGGYYVIKNQQTLKNAFSLSKSESSSGERDLQQPSSATSSSSSATLQIAPGLTSCGTDSDCGSGEVCKVYACLVDVEACKADSSKCGQQCPKMVCRTSQ